MRPLERLLAMALFLITRLDRLDDVAQLAREVGRPVEHEPVAGVLDDTRVELRGVRPVVIEGDGAEISVDRDDRHREVIHREVFAVGEDRLQDRRGAIRVHRHRVAPDPSDHLGSAFFGIRLTSFLSMTSR